MAYDDLTQDMVFKAIAEMFQARAGGLPADEAFTRLEGALKREHETAQQRTLDRVAASMEQAVRTLERCLMLKAVRNPAKAGAELARSLRVALTKEQLQALVRDLLAEDKSGDDGPGQ